MDPTAPRARPHGRTRGAVVVTDRPALRRIRPAAVLHPTGTRPAPVRHPSGTRPTAARPAPARADA
ncbi:hypothetical protein B1K54_30130 [Streptomyces sp. fd1-xmd]|nr:hypothetical protein B1K54_30130 [Streptomyces sp. fd1-xmd]